MALLAQVSTQKLITNTIQSQYLNFKDIFNTPGFIDAGFVTLSASSSSELYTFTNNSVVTGSVSSLGLFHYFDNTTGTGSLYVSSLYLGNLGGTSNGNLTTDANASNLYWNNNQISYFRKNLIVSTLGASEPCYISLTDIGTVFFFTSSGCNQNVYLPDTAAAGSGWNVLLKSTGFCNAFDIYDAGSNFLTTMFGYATSNVITDNTSWYFY